MIFEVLGGLLCVLGGVYSLHAKELMRGVLGLGTFFLGISILFGSMGAWFLAVGQIFLFIGGVVTLFVLAFSYTSPVTKNVRTFSGLLVGLALFGVLVLFLPATPVPLNPATLSQFATLFFSQYGLVVNVGILLLFSAVMTAQYIMTEESK